MTYLVLSGMLNLKWINQPNESMPRKDPRAEGSEDVDVGVGPIPWNLSFNRQILQTISPAKKKAVVVIRRCPGPVSQSNTPWFQICAPRWSFWVYVLLRRLFLATEQSHPRNWKYVTLQCRHRMTDPWVCNSIAYNALLNCYWCCQAL